MPYRSIDTTSPQPTTIVRRELVPTTRTAFRIKFWLQLVGTVVGALGASQWLRFMGYNTAAAFGVLALGGYSAFAWRRIRVRAKVLVADNNAASRLLGAGQLEAARIALDDLAIRARFLPTMHSLAIANRGVVALRESDPALAIELLESALRTGWFEKHFATSIPGLTASLALAYAMRGDLTSAESWQTRAKTKAQASQRGIFLLGDAIFLLRKGKLEEARARLIADWSEAESLVGAKQMRLLRILRAFSQRDDATKSDDVTQLLQGARPCDPGEFDYASVGWPEFHAYLQSHGFSLAATAG